MKVLSLILSTALMAFQLIAQEKNPDCGQLKNGTFYAYPRNSQDQYRIMRSGTRQVDYNLKTGDSTEYTVKWNNNCEYSLTFVASSEKRKPAELEVLKSFKQAYDILSTTADYYIYNVYLDKVINERTDYWQISTDTAWLKPIASPSNKLLYADLKEKPTYLRKHFNDTSSYAIVYLYRPNKIWGMKANYYVYCDQDLVYPAVNNTKVAYKIYKQGPTKIHAKLNKVEAKVNLDIQFGKKYYIECLLDNSPPKTTAVLKLKDEEKGQVDFESQ